MLENSLELIDYVYQGNEKFVRITKNDNFVRGALVSSFQIINSLFSVRYVGMLNGHKILDESFARLDKPNYYFEMD